MANPLNATFFALRKREKSGVLLGATVAYFVTALVLVGGFIALNYQSLGAVMTWYVQILTSAASGVQPTIDPSTMPPGIAMLGLTLFPFMFVIYVLFAAYEAACLRWMIRGETGGLMGLSLGADTWRVYLTYWIWFFLYIAFSIVFTILTGIAMAAGMATGNEADALMIGGPAVLIVTLVRIVLMLYFGVRLAPAAAISVGLKKFAFFKAWTVSRGRFWALLGAFLLTLVIFVIAEIIIGGVVFAVIGMGAMQMGTSSDPSQMFATLFTPQNLIVMGAAYALIIALSVLLYLLFFGINARAVIAAAEDGKIEGLSPETLAKTFE